MAVYVEEVSRTFGEYLLIPGLTTKQCVPLQCLFAHPAGETCGRHTSSNRIEHPFRFGNHAIGFRSRTGHRVGA